MISSPVVCPCDALMRPSLQQGAVTLAPGEGLELVRLGAVDDEVLKLGRHRHQLVDPGPAAVAGVAAGLAALDPHPPIPEEARGNAFELGAEEGGRVGGAGATRACPADEALRLDPAHGGDHEERLHPHVDEPGEAREGVVGVHGGEHEVPGEGGADRDLGRLEIADLADHDDVRVLAEDRAQGAGEGVADLGVGLDLGDVRHLVLDRVLHGDDLLDAVVDLLKARGEGRGLARAGGPGDEHDAVVGVEPAPEEAEVVLLHAEVGEGEVVALLREQPEHDGLAERAGHRRDPDVHLAARDARRDPAVLGEAALRDVDPGDELDARRDGGEALDGLGQPRVEDPVHPHPDRELLFGGLDVDVGGARVDGLGEQVVHELDDGRLLRHLPELAGAVARVEVLDRALLADEVEEPVDLVVGGRGRTSPSRGGRSR